MKHLTKFNRETEYDAAESSLVKPNVSYITETLRVAYNPVPSQKELVDLGLPSGTKWMKYNLGINPGQLETANDWYGKYYQWGEVVGYPDASGTKKFSWADYSMVIRSATGLVRDIEKDKEIGGTKYDAFSNDSETFYAFQSSYAFIFTYDEVNDRMVSISNGGAMYDATGITGIYFVDEIPVLDSTHDAVSVALGNDYHMPTKAQIQELKDNTTHRLIENYKNISGLNGMIFTSNYNEEELFIPFSGVYQDGLNRHINIQAGIISNESRLELPKSFWYLFISEDNVAMVDERERSLGYTLRGVKNN